jgi:monooxygenase
MCFKICSFKPWTAIESIADGKRFEKLLSIYFSFYTSSISIMKYLQETVAENNLEQHIALGVKVITADWDSADRSWHLTLSISQANAASIERRLRCNILYMCSGYFSYDTPHDPKFPGFEKFKGMTLHPQFWPSPCPPLQGKQVRNPLNSNAGPFLAFPQPFKRRWLSSVLVRPP